LRDESAIHRIIQNHVDDSDDNPGIKRETTPVQGEHEDQCDPSRHTHFVTLGKSWAKINSRTPSGIWMPVLLRYDKNCLCEGGVGHHGSLLFCQHNIYPLLIRWTHEKDDFWLSLSVACEW